VIDTTLVVLCAGNSSRFKKTTKKQWLRVADEPLWLYVTNKLSSYSNFNQIIVVGNSTELNYMKRFSDDFIFVNGGDSRQESMKNALDKVLTKFVMVTDVARCCVPKDIVLNLLKNKARASSIVPILDITDSVMFQNKTINRDEVKIIQTPQLSDSEILRNALNTTKEFTDDSSAIKYYGGTIFYIKGSDKSKKLTFSNELDDINCLEKPSNDIFSGIGIDIHQFENGKQMVLGGVKIENDFGFKAHSDGDVLVHSLIDALLGASGAGDIGEFFPDNDNKYKNINSMILLDNIVKFINNIGFVIINIDLTILAEVPKINKYKDLISKSLSEILNIPKYKINIKATTAEKMGYIGREEGVAVNTIATMKYYDWSK